MIKIIFVNVNKYYFIIFLNFLLINIRFILLIIGPYIYKFGIIEIIIIYILNFFKLLYKTI